jgi:hypothetical protein
VGGTTPDPINRRITFKRVPEKRAFRILFVIGLFPVDRFRAAG